MALNEKIEKICKEKGMKVRGLADACGIPVQYLYDIRNGKIAKISPERAQKINAVFPEYSVLWLLTGREESGKHSEEVAKDWRDEKIQELQEELRKANERIDILLNMLSKK